ncbi:MAG: DUF2062 domain-containing protein [Deltaproteobacteria bacterium]|jgi:hypothetical protein|nr:DUF2062 domain-containing protein [Deltaproteobacteria bacterium]
MKKKEHHTSRNKGHGLRKYNIREFVERAKTLQGDPHYIAVGMAIGVFVSITPTIPFHTIIAITLAFILKGSKPAAAVGVWFCNPITMPFFYLGSYQAGMLILNKSIPFNVKYESIQELMKLGWDVTIAMIIGGLVLGIIPGIAAYFITRKIFTKIRMRKKLES